MKSRHESLSEASLTEFDLLVIGGGIAGAGIAQNAASRGLKVVLIEKDDFASGTSSKTTKLIHGGLRYLEQFHLKLTSELCRERALLERLAPHLVRDFSFLLPLARSRALFNVKAMIGLTLYDLVALSSSVKHLHRRLSRKKTIEMAPALDRDLVTGGLVFGDCITDDSRIVLEVVKSAAAFGALAINYCQAVSIESESGFFLVGCRDRNSGGQVVLRARACVNATGVWSDEVCRLVDSGWKPVITPSKGIHIIVPDSVFETNSALFLPTSDRRYVFVVPWQRALMIGTTDERYTGDINSPVPNAREITYLLDVVNAYTRTHKIARRDITGSFAGLRPLVNFPSDAGSGDTSSMSREHLICEAPGGMLVVAGGKLTSYRIMAEEAVGRLAARFPAGLKRSNTRVMLGGWQSREDYLTGIASISTLARRAGLDPATIDHLIANYGADAKLVVEIVERNSAYAERICPDFPAIMAEVPFCVTCEMAVCLEDLLFRRLRLGILHHKQCLEAAPAVAGLMQALLGWDRARLEAELSAVRSLINRHMAPIDQTVGAH